MSRYNAIAIDCNSIVRAVIAFAIGCDRIVSVERNSRDRSAPFDRG
ncbi:MAG: hypothetical protein F6K28_61580 [Microcoleus sp. SIO2G3]|nr:hypothetical protein [Microcoleus sp. SIO2G3]